MVKLPSKSMKKKLITMWIFKVKMNLIIILTTLLTLVVAKYQTLRLIFFSLNFAVSELKYSLLFSNTSNT